MKFFLCIALVLQFVLVLVVWVYDQQRGASFEPKTVQACIGNGCQATDSAIVSALEARLSGGFAPFASTNFCVTAIEILSGAEAEDRGRWVVDALVQRSVLTVQYSGSTATVSPGPGLAISSQVSRLIQGAGPASCHLSRYDYVLPASIALFLLGLWGSFGNRKLKLGQ